jgi:hypothetical protein
MPSAAGVRAKPFGRSSSPWRRSSPASRTFAPRFTGDAIFTRAPSDSVASTGTTESAPAGSGAPVMIRIAVPGLTASLATLPAGTSSRTWSETGEPAEAPAQSSARTA